MGWLGLYLGLALSDVAPFQDFDCDLAHTVPGAVTNWNDVYEKTVQGVVHPELMESSFSLPADLEHLLKAAAPECPLGLLYLQILHFYQGGSQHEDEIQRGLGRFPTFVTALSRWPIFPALAYFKQRHREDASDYMSCEALEDALIDWDRARALGQRWSVLTFRNRTAEEELECIQTQAGIREEFYVVLRKPYHQEKAFEECPFGFFFLAATQLVGAAGMGTSNMPPFSKLMDEVVSTLPFVQVSESPWPVWHVLAVFADMNKGQWYWGGDRKYFRTYGDWNLRRDELSPLVDPSLDFLSEAWKAEVASRVTALQSMPPAAYVEALQSWTRGREASGPLRPMARSILDVAAAVAATGERLAYVVLLYGDRWAALLERMAERLRQLELKPLLVIASGEAEEVCRGLSGQNVICWVPDAASQVHRFTAIQGLIHLGIDVIYWDMDTFLLRDPTARFKAAAQGWDALFARHGDGDCVNIGVFYLKANARTAVWMSQFLAWYHDHPFEIDQRGLHVFLSLPAEALKVAYVPEDLVEIRGSVLEDLNEVVIGDVGWVGDLPRMLIFHWCHRPLGLKVSEINLAYDAADALVDHDLPLSVALSVASGAVPGGRWAKVLAAKFMLESYQLQHPPVRSPCW